VRIYPPVFLFLHLLMMVALHRLVPGPQMLAWPERWLGLIPILAGIAVAVTGARLFGRRGTTVKPFEESSALVIEGPFHYSRNPMYASLTALLVGTALLLGSTTPWLAIFTFLWIIQQRFIVHEEAKLDARFGDEYGQYKLRVRRWIGRR
jgi:protein-S-isoprenylcysteine O-methyltransferase Ste14